MRTFAGSALFQVALPPGEARELFTPEGERRWVKGWDPSYPDPTRTEGVGATFVTRHGDTETVWVMTDDEPDRVRYARIGIGVDAGIVEVRCAESGHGITAVTVSYQLTALTRDGGAHLDAFAAHYDEFIASWEREIARMLTTDA